MDAMDPHSAIDLLWNFTKAHVYSSIRGKEDREDLIHDILVLYLEMANNYKVPEEAFIRLARTAARNRVRDFIRKHSVRMSRVPNLPWEVEGICEFRDSVETKIILDNIQNKLSSEHALVFDALREGIELGDIRREAGISRTELWRITRGIKEVALRCIQTGGIAILIFLGVPRATEARPDARTGTASWYSTEACRFNPDPRCPTASGRSLYELVREKVPYCASFAFPIGTHLKITNRKYPARHTECYVLDRGPARRLGRLLDLNPRSFSQIEMPSHGTTQIVVEVI